MTNRIEHSKPTRREFLYYFGGAVIVLMVGETCEFVTRYARPEMPSTSENGVFYVELSLVRSQSEPKFFEPGQCWLVNIQGNLSALDKQCVFDKVDLKWVSFNKRFECPGCGSKFHLDGSRIEGPANRNMDYFNLWVTKPNGDYVISQSGGSVGVEGADSILIDTRQIIQGKPRV